MVSLTSNFGLANIFNKDNSKTGRVYKSLISKHLSEKTMSLWKRIVNKVLMVFGYYFKHEIYNTARQKELADALKLKICKDLTFVGASQVEGDLKEQAYVNLQKEKISLIFSDIYRGFSKQGARQGLYSIFTQNPLLTFVLIRQLEKRGLIRCFSLEDLIQTLLYSMDWQTGKGPYVDAITDVQAAFEALASGNQDQIESALLTSKSKHYQHNLDLLEDMSSMPAPDFKISDVSYLSWEFKGFYEVGGLAEAAFSIAKSFRDKKPDVPARVILPYFPELIKAELKPNAAEPKSSSRIGPSEKIALNENSSINIRRLKKDNLEIIFVEDPSFNKIKKLYGKKEENGGNVETMMQFCKLASSFLLKTTTPSSVIHLNDWHVARVAALVKDASIELPNQDKPTVVFTFHNNNVPCQGRFAAESPSAYTSAYTSSDVEYGLHLQKQAIACADVLSTVSPTYAQECLTKEMGHGLEDLLEGARKAGRYYGILNGIHAASWNPYKLPVLQNWKSIESGESINLCFEEGKDPYDKKKLALKELNAWIKKYWTEKNKAFDEEKPLFVYTGRYDYAQKGLAHMPAIIEEVVKQGGNVLLLGSSADDHAKALLTQLIEKYKSNSQVVIIEDAMEKGRYKYQEASGERPGIKELTRMAASAMLMTSNFEPCGLVQLESFKFGSIVIARKTGGLADTVIPFTSTKAHPNGYFVGDMPLEAMVRDAMMKAQDPDIVTNIVKGAPSYNWDFSPATGFSKIDAYERLYQIGHKHKHTPIAEKTKVKMDEAWILSSGFHEIDPAHTKIHHVLGAHSQEGGIKYAVYAPKAKSVTLQIFDDEGRLIDSQKMYKSTVSGNFIYNAKGDKSTNYRFVIDGKIKIDPFAKGFKNLPNQKGVPVCVHYPDSETQFDWTDASHIIERKAKKEADASSTLFEMHLASFAKDHAADTYDKMAAKLIELSKKQGFKKVELMGISEHPYEGSLGYQITGFFAPNHRYGSPQDFKRFVNSLHEAGLEVVVDFVFNHFAKDSWGLKQFDGSNLFEKSNFWDLRQWYGWGRYFNLANPYSQKFLFSSIRNWVETYHIDGFRVDAIRPAHRELGSFAPRFLQTLNAFIHKHFPGIKMYAEDYRPGTNAIEALQRQGLGFDSKWNLGMIHHALHYLEDKAHARAHLEGLVSSSRHNEVFALSHDHVNTDLGFIDTRAKATSAHLKTHKINHTLLLASILPGEKLVYHDAAALRAWEAIEKLKTENKKAKTILEALPACEFELNESSDKKLFIITAKNKAAVKADMIKKLKEQSRDVKELLALVPALEAELKADPEAKTYRIVINIAESQTELPDVLKTKEQLVSSYDLEHDRSQDTAIAEGQLRPFEARIFEA
jgi:1,4-alpha-glucan branching enzyme/glycogen synthase